MLLRFAILKCNTPINNFPSWIKRIPVVNDHYAPNRESILECVSSLFTLYLSNKLMEL